MRLISLSINRIAVSTRLVSFSMKRIVVSKRLIVLLGVLVGLACCCGCPLGTPYDHSRPVGHGDMRIAVSPEGDAVLFNAVGKGKRDLYLLDLATKKVTRLTDSPAYETAASFSPDGQRIVFSAGLPGDRADHLFVMNRDGTGRVQLTDLDANDTSARFSPDGKMIVFARDKTYNWGGLAANWSETGVICLVDVDGGNFRQLTKDGEHASDPSFSADGSQIFYATPEEVRSISALESAPSLSVIPRPKFQRWFGLSPDGKQVVYIKGELAPECKVYVANMDMTGERCLTPESGFCRHPVFSADGKTIWFLRDTWEDVIGSEPKASIWKVGVDGKGLQEVTDTSLFDDPLKWAPGK